MGPFQGTIGILKNRQGYFDDLLSGRNEKEKLIALTLGAITYFAIYGFVSGLYHSWLQALSSAVKLPMLYILTLVVCFPTLFVFNTIIGTKYDLMQHA